MDPERKLGLVMGAGGALSFGVLYQGYVLLDAGDFDPLVLFAGMAIAGAITTMLAPGLRRAVVAHRDAETETELETGPDVESESPSESDAVEAPTTGDPDG